MLGTLLKQFGISRTDLAHRLNVSVQTIHNWCSERVRVPSSKLEPLGRLLETWGIDKSDVNRFVVQELEAHGIKRDRLASPASEIGPSVMMMTWDLMNAGLFGPAAKVCRATLEQFGYQCVVVDCSGEHRLKRSYIKRAVDSGIAGLVLCGISGELPDPDTELFTSLEPAVSAGIPVVLLKPWTGSTQLPLGVGSIGWDSVAAIRMSVNCLTSLGHSEIRAILSSSDAGFGGRYRGLDLAWAGANLPFSDDSVIWMASQTNDTSELAEFLGSATAVFSPPSHLPLLARTCFEMGMRWPDDISIASLGHLESIAHVGRRPFTYVNLPLGRVSRGAADLLVSMMRGERFQTGQEYVLYGESAMSLRNIENGSVGPPRVVPVATAYLPATLDAVSSSH